MKPRDQKKPEPGRNDFHNRRFVDLPTAAYWLGLKSRTLNTAERDILIVLAGHAAEHWLHLEKHLECTPDIDQVLTFAEMCCGNLEKASAYVRSVWQRTHYLFSTHRYWTAVVALANELLKPKELDGERAFQIIQEALAGYAEAA